MLEITYQRVWSFKFFWGGGGGRESLSQGHPRSTCSKATHLACIDHIPITFANNNLYTMNMFYFILLYSCSSAATCNPMSSFKVSIPGASRQRYFPSSNRGTISASFGSLRWDTKVSLASTRIQRLSKSWEEQCDSLFNKV